MSSAKLERIPGAVNGPAIYGRKNEEYIADFCSVSKRTLADSPLELQIFKFHFLLGADWKLCCRQLKMDRGSFFPRGLSHPAEAGPRVPRAYDLQPVSPGRVLRWQRPHGSYEGVRGHNACVHASAATADITGKPAGSRSSMTLPRNGYLVFRHPPRITPPGTVDAEDSLTIPILKRRKSPARHLGPQHPDYQRWLKYFKRVGIEKATMNWQAELRRFDSSGLPRNRVIVFRDPPRYASGESSARRLGLQHQDYQHWLRYFAREGLCNPAAAKR